MLKGNPLGSITPIQEIVTWWGFVGFQGGKCGHCEATENLLCNIPGYICSGCGHFNILSWFGHYRFTFKVPTFGYGRAALREVVEKFLPKERRHLFGLS